MIVNHSSLSIVVTVSGGEVIWYQAVLFPSTTQFLSERSSFGATTFTSLSRRSPPVKFQFMDLASGGPIIGARLSYDAHTIPVNPPSMTSESRDKTGSADKPAEPGNYTLRLESPWFQAVRLRANCSIRRSTQSKRLPGG